MTDHDPDPADPDQQPSALPATDTSTRQRLLNLWEKCPNCRPKGLDWRCGVALEGLNRWELGVHWISTEDSFALARDAMVRWLAGKAPGVYVSYEPNDDVWCVGGYAAGGNTAADTLIDALISAVEAVLEKKDDMATPS